MTDEEGPSHCLPWAGGPRAIQWEDKGMVAEELRAHILFHKQEAKSTLGIV